MQPPSGDYHAYLQGEHWIEFSRRIKAQRPNCERCGCDRSTSMARFELELHVHHKTYERIGRELQEDVEVLCFECHLISEHGSGDPKVNWKAVASHFAMPAVSPIATSAPCENCTKPIRVGRIFNRDELDKLEGLLCEECS